jgi:hypothetical protein
MIILDPIYLKKKGLLKGVTAYAYAFVPSTPSVQPTQEQPLANQFLQSYGAYASSAQPFLQLNQQYQPGYGTLDLQLLQQQLYGNAPQAATPGGRETISTPIVGRQGRIRGYTPTVIKTPGTPASPGVPGTLQLGESASTSLRGANVADVANLGPEAVQAYLQSNPYLGGSLNQLYSNTVQSPILSQLGTQAQQQLAQGGQLSPQELNMINQSTAAGFQQLGMANQGTSLGAQLLNEDQYSRQRLQEAQQLGETVQGLGSSELGQASQVFQGTLADPYQAVLGQSSGAGLFGPSGSAQVSSGLGSGTAINQANTLFNPTNSYLQDFYNTQFNANAAANIGNANAQSAYQAGVLGLYGNIAQSIGSAVGGAYSDKRLKENIVKVGKTDEGIGIYEWNYKGSNKKFRGPVAQDVEKKKPWAVKERDGFKTVDLAKAKVPFQRVGQWDFMTGQVKQAA